MLNGFPRRTLMGMHAHFPPTQPLTLLLTLQLWRDPQLHAHAERVSELTRALCARLGLPASEKGLISLAALVHDVGKLLLPDLLLQKAGPLEEQEWNAMRCHPELGSHLLQQAGGVCVLLAPLVASHHEHWDMGSRAYRSLSNASSRAKTKIRLLKFFGTDE
jgi:response regulator RpfG family c-di-GMP phosphodiesterase